MQKYIKVKGAKVNNLKNIDLDIPREKLVVFTGVSGSGKSTLAFDTIFAEGQRKFMESLSSYARMFLGQIQKPEVESIEGLSPCISIDQKTTSRNPRSTVGTVTEIYDYLRLMYAHIGTVFCPHCHKPIAKQSIDEIVDRILQCEQGSKIIVMAPIVRGEKGTHQKLFENLKKSGFVRVNVDGNNFTLDEEINLDKNKKHNINVVVDRLVNKENITSRLTESLETALKQANGLCIVNINGEDFSYNTNYACSTCGASVEEVSPRVFSFNNPFGACSHCLGLGFKSTIDKEKILAKKHLSINEGALSFHGWNVDLGSVAEMYFKGLSKKYNFSLNTPVQDLPADILNILLYGSNGEEVELDYTHKKFKGVYKSSFEGVIPLLQRRYEETKSDYTKHELSRLMMLQPCEECGGKRLKPESLSVYVNNLNISQFCDMSVEKALNFIENLKLNKTQTLIATPILKEIKARLNFLNNVGLNYLTLSRSADTLSGGEAQRIRLATQIGSGLTGVLYVLDEPSIGLHQRDNDRLIQTLKNLRDMGNSVIVVEHDEDTIRNADFIVDVGPQAGVHGGEIVATGSVKDIINSPRSLSGKYLSGEYSIDVPDVRNQAKGWLEVKGAKQNNLKNINVKFPSGVFTCVTGISGSGKSSLVNGILYPSLANKLNRANLQVGKCSEIVGYEQFDKVICINQEAIGRTPRSNPATYTGVFTLIRDLFASTPEAKERGYASGRFSFNVKGGRCESCEGDGSKQIEMYFLPDMYVECEVCKGKRYNRETLEVKYKGKNIHQVLDMTVEEALKFFENIPSIKNKIQSLYDVGLGYIKLGQSATTLSGGESQRVKLATELSKRSTGKTVYILDEPTTGLHIHDVKKLVSILQRLVKGGNTVIVIEHNLDVIKVADYIIDLGPEGGDNGGTVVATGTPEQVANNKNSATGIYLKKYLK